MGKHDVRESTRVDELRLFMKSLLDDVRAMERMLETGAIETGVRRIGAEQELFLVDETWRPAPIAAEVLQAVDDPHFTTELARFNLEFNMDPLLFGGSCLRTMEHQMEALLERARAAARRSRGEVVMSGILPTLTKSDLGLDNMTPNPRYLALNDAMTRLRGGEYVFNIKGIDELAFHHDSIMVEACNTSFQVHFQVGPEEFARVYNMAQAAAGPVLAAAANSPLLFGKRLWWETRVALFQQSIDTRRSVPHLRDQTPRVSFGRQWVHRSALEIFREDIARFRPLLSAAVEEDPLAVLDAGRIPMLRALQLHNGTVYRWNRVCYGVSDEGKAQLRIENRTLPAGPTVLDEVANAAFWFGLVSGMMTRYADIAEQMTFDDAHTNFFAAAQHGLNAQLAWAGGRLEPARTLILETLLPLAKDGLMASQIDEDDIARYLGVIEERVASNRTGAQWLLDSFASLGQHGPLGERLSALTGATAARQREGAPVHRWAPARIEEGGGWKQNFLFVEQYMRTDLITVTEDEPIDLVAQLMEWNRVRYILVENDANELVGIVSQRALARLVGRMGATAFGLPVSVGEVMRPDPVTVSPETSTLDAIALMRRRQIACLPVVKNNHLVGVMTQDQFMEIAGRLLEEKLRRS